MTSSVAAPVPRRRTSGPYSTNVPGSHRSSMFSRAVRCPVRAALGDGLGPGGVERGRVPLEHLGQVGADVVEVDLVVDRRRRRPRRRLIQQHEHVALVDGVAGLRRSPARSARSTGALISCSIFMASITRTWRPATTTSPALDLETLTIGALHRGADGDGARSAGRPSAGTGRSTRDRRRRRLAESRTASGSASSRGRTPAAAPAPSATPGTRQRRATGRAGPSSSSRWSSTKRVVGRRRRKSGWASTARRKARFVAGALDAELASARRGAAGRRRQVAASAWTRPPWPAASRRRARSR